MLRHYTRRVLLILLMAANLLLGVPVVQAATPLAPNSVSAGNTVRTATSLSVSWFDNATNDIEFYVERSTDGVTYGSRIIVPSTMAPGETGPQSTIVTGLIPNTEYWFRVAAHSLEEGMSAYATTHGGTFTLASPPPAPTSIYAVANGATSLRVFWTDNASNEDGFYLARSTDGSIYGAPTTLGRSVVLNGLDSGFLSYTVNNLTPNTTYWFKIAAFNASGGSSAYVAMSTSNGVSTAALPAPLAPANVSASQATATSLKVSWTDNATDETGFLIAKSTDSLNFDAPITVGASSVLGGVNTGAVSYTFTNLTPNTTYWFKVASQNATGLSAYVLGLNGSATLALTPQLSNASASAESKSRVAVSWQGTAAQYLVTNVTNGTNSGWQTATSYAFAGLTCGTTYTFEIVGKDAQGTLTAPITVSSATQACADLPLVPPLAPALCPTLAPNNLIKVTGAPAIYALDSSLRYRYFADGDVFKSWNMDDGYSGKYISVTPACFNNLSAPAAPPFHVFYRPGSFVVRSAIDAKQLYVVQPGRVLAPITKAAADALYGTAAPKIIGLSEWPYYTKNGSAISGAVPHPGMVVKVSGTIWYITTNLERREVSGEGMSLNRFKQSFVRTVPASSVANYPIGMSIVDYESALSDRLGQ